MRFLTILLLVSYTSAQDNIVDGRGVHLPLYRRGGPFLPPGSANLTHLSRGLARIEARYARTYTDVEGNRIVRRWHDGPHGADDYLLGSAGSAGSWSVEFSTGELLRMLNLRRYTILQVGDPPQELEVDIDMLSPDFYTIMTTSGRGSKYDSFASSSHEPSQELIHPTCLKITEVFNFPVLDSSSSSTTERQTNGENHHTTESLRIPFPICQPPKYTYQTLFSSGSILGLAPTHNNHPPLARLDSPSLLIYLLSTTTISDPLIHITLLTSTEGLLSLGTPPTYLLEHTKITLERQLSFLSSHSSHDEDATRQAQLEKEVAAAMNFLVPSGSSPETQFTWTDSGNGGVRGWHTGLLSGVWVNGVKVLKNQAVIFDINCPVILVPQGVGEVIFGGAGGHEVDTIVDDEETSIDKDNHGPQQEDARHQDQNSRTNTGRGFWTYPCLNPPTIQIELGGWRFPITTRDDFEIGKVDLPTSSNKEEEIATGYCVSVITETDMGDRTRWSRSGMKDVWVLGEPFFRSVGVVFDFGGDGKKGKGGRVGVRKY